MRVAVLHNRKPDHIESCIPEDTFEEYDSAETIDAIVQALARLGVTPEPVASGRDLPQRLDGAFDFVFNIAEGEGRRCREAIPAAVCELLGLPYTGSDPLTLAVTLDKTIARRIVSPDVPVAAASTGGELNGLRYPVIVKPNDEGSSKGIRLNSLCRDRSSAEQQSRWLQSQYACPVLVEEWLQGPEVTAGVAGNGDSVRVLGLMEIAPAQPGSEPFIYSLEIKRDWRNQVRYHIPPRLPAATLDTIRAYALRAWHLLGCRDIARIDFRLDAAGHPHFLECNPLPGLDPQSSDLVIMTRALIGYDQLVQGILCDAAKRHGIVL